MSASEAPVLLGRICSSWRAISLSTPCLWAKVHIVEPSPPPYMFPDALFDQKVTQRLETTKMWLGRSGQCPLSISLYSASEDGNAADASEVSVQFLQVLVPFASRWQHIHFTTPLSLLLEIISHIDTDMPWLETVAFHHQVHRSLQNIKWGSFKMLRGARISSFYTPGSIFIPERFPLRWNQLTTLTIGGPSWTVLPELTSQETLRVISRCPELRCCKLMVNDPFPEIPGSHLPIVELPFLHTLAVHCVACVAPAVSVLLKRLSLPELRNFTFLASGSHGQDSPALADFFARSTCLESVEINSNTFLKTTFLEGLRSLPPTIQWLQIRDRNNAWGVSPTPLDDDTLAILTSPELCPALQHFSVDHGFSMSDAAILRFITARMLEPQNTLQQVNIEFNRQMTLDIMPSLQPFIEAGLAISLIYQPPFQSQFSPWHGLADAPTLDAPLWFPPPMLPHW
ncbi:hypothetical protein MVEN_02094500 [Mycena venus]|uniref:F-box domain-containing protein n=1 Tax=Mycena venus TaxID=2733690 RepID=A0A8H7CI93_9AGAR|nr:hypothetical protein MVEN_02094500 [Mycena venus]